MTAKGLELVLTLAQAAVPIIAAAGAAGARWLAANSVVQKMVDENRDPTPEERAVVLDSLRRGHDELLEAARRAEAAAADVAEGSEI